MVRIMTYYHSYESCKVCVIVCMIDECHIKNTVWIFFVDATCLNQIEFSSCGSCVVCPVSKKKKKEMHY